MNKKVCAECFTPCISCCYHLWNRKELTNDFEVLAHKKSVQSFIEYIVYIYHWQYTSVSRILSVFFFFCVLFVCLFVWWRVEDTNNREKEKKKEPKVLVLRVCKWRIKECFYFELKGHSFVLILGDVRIKKLASPRKKSTAKKKKNNIKRNQSLINNAMTIKWTFKVIPQMTISLIFRRSWNEGFQKKKTSKISMSSNFSSFVDAVFSMFEFVFTPKNYQRNCEAAKKKNRRQQNTLCLCFTS